MKNQITKAKASGRTRKIIKKIILIFLLLGIAAGFILFSAYTAAIIGENFVQALLSPVLFLLAPIFALYKLFKGHHHRLGLSFALTGAIYWFISFILILGASSRTIEILNEHGNWFLDFSSTEKREKGDLLLSRFLKKITGNRGEVPFIYKDGSIIISATIYNGNHHFTGNFILDTGATISTINNNTFEKLKLSRGNSSMAVQTAGGSRELPVILLDKVEIGNNKISPLVFSICDNCSGPGISGLIGLNFTSRFQTIIDNKKAIIQFKKIDHWIDQRNEIEPFLEIDSIYGVQDEDTFIINAKTTNQAKLPIEGIVFEITLYNQKKQVIDRLRTRIALLKPGNSKKIEVTTDKNTQIENFEVRLERAFWKN
ncbi:MAG: retropepsin-like aspartic protease family protein [Myxococcota bacterium]